MPITGGEGLFGLEPFRDALTQRAYDIVQPENRRSGGIWICRKVAALAEAFHVPCVLHGTMGLMLAGALQISAAIQAEWQEFVFIRPPLMPEEVWSPGLEVLNTGGDVPPRGTAIFTSPTCPASALMFQRGGGGTVPEAVKKCWDIHDRYMSRMDAGILNLPQAGAVSSTVTQRDYEPFANRVPRVNQSRDQRSMCAHRVVPGSSPAKPSRKIQFGL